MKTIRVSITYDDNTEFEITGDDAEKLMDTISGMAAFMQNRSGNMNPFARWKVPWRPVKK